ncbi:AbiJ-NTD4 domain-containing protein [Taibaiella helva]|uniref:AbiJ-NTD4 domain-containing protein n=1 Tax=Taibaiella helva TaxID=2301235 RepID=UPI000E57EFB9|nr:hypothetical protein [Taibaiella helva]
MKFSQRTGFIPVGKDIQIESIDSDLKNTLWNVFDIFVVGRLKLEKNITVFYRDYLWSEYFKNTIDTAPRTLSQLINHIRNYFFSCQWYELYDFIEFTVFQLGSEHFDNFFEVKGMVSMFNRALKKEASGYRFVNNKIAPIANTEEISEYELAVGQTISYTALKGANIHLRDAMQKLSDRKNPDYRNSIKESISAVESLAKVISNGAKDSLGGALDKIKGKIKLHQSLERGFKQIYGYTSDGDGIRHSLSDEPNCDFDDAKFMLVSCSAFINYLISKSIRVGVDFARADT